MNKDWDKAIIGVEYWKECLRVLKPGAFSFIMSAPRQDVLSRIICNLSEAGFEVGFTSIYWAYACGFPKAMNISKKVDKILGAERISLGKHPNARETLGTVVICKKNGDGQLRPIPATKEAKVLDGSYAGFNPKPAVEVIIIAMKPLSEKTYVEQALKNGKGITWLDDCRIPLEENSRLEKGGSYTERKCNNNSGFLGQGNYKNWLPQEGRFPANLLVSDDFLNDGKEWKSGGDVSGNEISHTGDKNTVAYGEYGRISWNSYGDKGSFSRYFDLDRWFNEKLKQLPESIQKTFPFLITSKASRSEKNKGCGCLYWQDGKLITEEKYRALEKENKNLPIDKQYKIFKGNIHPTSKPIALMSFLISMGSREKDIILDPFCGGGTTCVSAKMLNRRFIGIEIKEEYVQIAQKRIDAVEIPLFNMENHNE